jgi:hypothetical protein
VGRVTRPPPKPKPKYPHEVRIGDREAEQAWIWEEAARIGGHLGYQTRSPFWACRILAFDTPEKAGEMQRRLTRWRRERDLAALRSRPCPDRRRL